MTQPKDNLSNWLNPIRRKWSNKISHLGSFLLTIAALLAVTISFAPYLKIYFFEPYVDYLKWLAWNSFKIGLPTMIIDIFLMPNKQSYNEFCETEDILSQDKDLYILKRSIKSNIVEYQWETDAEGLPLIVHKKSGYKEKRTFFLSKNAGLLFFLGILLLFIEFLIYKFTKSESIDSIIYIVTTCIAMFCIVTSFYPKFIFICLFAFNAFFIVKSGLDSNNVFEWHHINLKSWIVVCLSILFAWGLSHLIKPKFTPNEFSRNWRKEYRERQKAKADEEKRQEEERIQR
jgi:hypothetical protein